ncbi:MAG: MBL fold metallo-hydrolase [Nitrospirae bacterium GWC2_57_13]|jgi:anaerobic nitric oxide reductase flavorubredoxin|nr:MAG: MBL fold metallo-hydrolase [Nitrospirae bacterium GWC1_57_7]OGW26507.1 MAG: MBL fold metallo-hydrolase [Nitrospirae bacterium GWC2_57_13]HAR45995.1 MBL fold metallo-hydrolase [Nitrospiraceae bacterium]HAS52682.1 MBL fold metallo-hydrolase [Nitrospiraceae bacterium]
MGALEIKPGIFWVGAIDWAVRDFHGYITPNGTTYNNYLIKDKHITLVDTVKHDFSDYTIDNIRDIVDPAKIENIVINHIENDHMTSIDRIMALAPKAVIYITERGKKGLDRFFDASRWNIRLVKTGDTLSTGSKTILFLETPMLHWPDSMMSYVKEDKLLISQDGFGQHIASTARFDDEYCDQYSITALEHAVRDYYANILMPFGPLIKAKLAEIQKLGLEIDMIAPDHGIIWRKDPGKIVKMYLDMANGKADLRVVIIYDTMWHSTEHMTIPIMEGIRAAGVDVEVIKLRSTPMSVAVKRFWESRAMLVGTPTLNNIMFPSVAEFLAHLRGLRPRNRMAGAFGSFGWGGGAVKEACEEMKKIGLDVVEPGMEVLYKPGREDEKSCFEFGKQFAEKVIAYHQKF